MIRGDDRGRVVADSIMVGERERPHARARRKTLDRRITGHGSPRATQALEPDGGGGERLQGMHRTDAQAGAPCEQLLEHVETVRAGEMHDERAGLDRRLRGRAGPARSRGRAWRRSRARRRVPLPRRARAATRGRRPRPTVEAASGARPATATTFQPISTGRARSWCRRGPARSGRRCSVVPPWRIQCYRREPHALPGRIGVDQIGGNVTQRRQHEAPFPHAGMRDHEVAGVEPNVVVQQDVDVEGARSPTFAAFRAARRVRGPARARAMRPARARCRSRRPRSDTHPAAGRRPARSRRRAIRTRRDTAGAVASASTACCKNASRSPRFEPRARYARVNARSARQRGRASARTGGCSLRTSTTTPSTRGSARHTSAIRAAKRSSRR